MSEQESSMELVTVGVPKKFQPPPAELSKAAAMMMLEPLCRATETQLAPARLGPHDYLIVELDEKGDKFVVTCISLIEVEMPDQEAPLMISGGGVEVIRDFKEMTFKLLSGRQARLRTAYDGHPSYGSIDSIRAFPQSTATKRVSQLSKVAPVYTLPLTDVTCLMIQHKWPAERVAISDDAYLVYSYQVVRFYAQSSRAAMNAMFKVTGELPVMPPDFKMVKGLELAPYQQCAFAMCTGMESFGLLQDRGTGKTPVPIARICYEGTKKLESTGEMYRAIVVCPQQVRMNWSVEASRFATSPGKVTILRGSDVDRARALVHSITPEPDCHWSLTIIGYDSASTKTMDFLEQIPWDLVILDESHWVKSSRTRRFKMMTRLRASSKARMILTGTPIGNSIVDLWSQLEFLGEGLSGFTSMGAFQDFYRGWIKPEEGTGVERLASIKNCALIQERLARLTFSITKQEAGLNLPDKVHEFHEVTMTPRQRRMYEEMAEELATEIEDELETSTQSEEVMAQNILVKLLRLAQICSGFIVYPVVRDPDTGAITRERTVNQIDAVNPKVEAVVDILTAEDRDPRSKAVIWCVFKEDIGVLRKRLDGLGIKHAHYFGETTEAERDAAVKDFNDDPEMRVMICNPQTASEGLNLVGYDYWNQPPRHETYCDTVIFFSCNWSAIMRAQAEDRAHRRGTRMPVRIIDVVVPGTIDEEIRQRVSNKRVMADIITDIRDLLKGLRAQIYE